MNRIVSAVIILTVSLSTALYSYWYTHKICTEMTLYTETAIELLQQNKKSDGMEYIASAVNVWENNRLPISLTINKEQISCIRGELKNADFFCRSNDSDTAIIHLRNCITEYERILRDSEASATTIF